MTDPAARKNTSTSRIFYGYIVVTIAFFINFFAFGSNAAFGVFFNPMLTELGWTRALTSGAFTISWIVQGVLGIFMGRLNDKLGPRLVISISGLFLGSGYLLMSLVDDVWKFYLFYGLIIGIGMSGLYVSLSSTVVHWFTTKRGLTNGIFQAGSGAGTLVMTPLAHFLIAAYSWQISYFIFGIIILFVLLIASRFLRFEGSAPASKESSATIVEEHNTFDSNTLSLRDASKTRQFWLMMGVSACIGFPMYIVMVHIVPHAIDIGIGEATAAGILGTIGASVTAGRLVLGAIADRIGFKKVIGIGNLLIAAVMFCLPVTTESWTLYLLAIILGFAWGSAICHAPLTAELFGLGAHGFILGFVGLGYTVGTGFGPLFGGFIFDIARSYGIAFLAGGIVSLIGLMLILFIAPTKTSKEEAKV